MPSTLQQVLVRLERSEHERAAELKTFAKGLLGKSDPAFFDEFDDETLYAMTLDAFGWFEERDLDAPDPPVAAERDVPGVAVEVFDPSYPADGWEAPYTVLRLALEDRPFIVDSVRAELRRHGFVLGHLLHPIYSVRRGDDGAIEAISEQRDGTAGGHREAFEMYFVERLSPDEREALAADVERVLGDVLLATGDYDRLRAKAHEVADYLRDLRAQSAQGFQRGLGEELEEYARFVEWLDDDNFVFLGYREYDIHERDDARFLQLTPGSGLGILRKTHESAYREPVPLDDIPDGLRERVTGGRVFVMTKTNAEATVHRPARMDYLGVKKVAEGWKIAGERRFVGLFTSKALSTSIDETPILRRKLEQVLERDEAIPESHDYKQIVAIFNSMPRGELFWADSQTLHKEIRTIMELEQERGVRLTLRRDPLARGLAAMVIMPRERFNSEVRRAIQSYLADELRADHVDYQLAMGEDESQVRFHFFFTTDLPIDELDARELEREIAEFTRSWSDRVEDRLVQDHGETVGRRLARRYVAAFDERYRADVGPGSAVRDIDNLEQLEGRDFRVDLLSPVEGGPIQLKIYHRRGTLVLSEVLPRLENLGFRVLEQIPYPLDLREVEGGGSDAGGDAEGGAANSPLGIDLFRVTGAGGVAIDVRRDRDRLVGALERMLAGDTENDWLNRLVLLAGLTDREVALLRTYQMYFGQLNAVTSRRFITDTLLSHPSMAAALVGYFRARFDPELGPADDAGRAEAVDEAERAVLDGLEKVASLPADSTLRGLLDLMKATVRSNYFGDSRVLAIKIDSGRVASMPDPRPLYEIGVLGPRVEGTHLRGGRVARGGIRWSDRPDDFRTEILGLMKTQMTKNAVIVPVGSKGGFIVKDAPEERDALREYVANCYQAYIRALLEITDNRVGDHVEHPDGMVIYDDPDPYLVVAADKGTATFSDLANEISAERGFWLGDAFASGGSHGYDHKAEGITANGAWECVSRHFREMGVDVHQDPVTAVGIGDMSGDVFGNGMLYTRTLRLRAAFNHRHIFLDPDPDPEASYDERARLFALPRSSWTDYDASLLSEGGGIHERGAKKIQLTPQVRAMLGVDDEALAGQDLVRAVLRMEVDLLWNGGIGTYVKSREERHADVGDSANDAVRVDAADLRAKVVGEGGNLGFTQLGRIEFAQGGGRINTDAIDNSGGVDMSDHEVNIKIALQPLVTRGEMTMVQRNRLLESMTDDVSSHVLRDNAMQSLALSLAERRGSRDFPLFASLQEYLTERGGLDPDVEFLPTRRELDLRRRSGSGYTRPELAILMAYVKMGLYRRLLDTDFPDEPYFRHYLRGYFPDELVEAHADAVEEHPLKREITATQFTNRVVDILGATFVHRSLRDTGATPVEVVRSALIAFEVLDMPDVLARILDDALPTEGQYEALDALVRAVESLVQWMLLNALGSADVETFVDTYSAPLAVLLSQVRDFVPEPEKRRYDDAVERFASAGLNDALAAEVASFDYVTTSMGIVDVAREQEVELEFAARRFYLLGERMALGWLRDEMNVLVSDNRWERIALAGLIMDLRRAQRNMTARFVAREDADVDAFLEDAYPSVLERFDTAFHEMMATDELSLASGAVLARILVQAAG